MTIETIGTHDGGQHADDQVAVAILTSLFKDAKITRTRDVEKLREMDARVDVGGKNDPNTGDFDHHQPEGAGVRENGVPYASAGLVWRHFGAEFCKEVATKHGLDPSLVAEEVDRIFIQGIDAMDTGVARGGYTAKGTENKIIVASMSDIVGLFNPEGFLEESNREACDQAFEELLPWTRRILEKSALQAAGILKSKEYVLSCDDGSPVLVLDKGCDWRPTVCAELPDVHYVVYESRDGKWRCQTVPHPTPDSFENRHPLPAAWAGLSGEELQSLTGVEDADFCHRACFIAGADSRDGAIRLAQLAVDSE